MFDECMDISSSKDLKGMSSILVTVFQKTLTKFVNSQEDAKVPGLISV